MSKTTFEIDKTAAGVDGQEGPSAKSTARNRIEWNCASRRPGVCVVRCAEARAYASCWLSNRANLNWTVLGSWVTLICVAGGGREKGWNAMKRRSEKPMAQTPFSPSGFCIPSVNGPCKRVPIYCSADPKPDERHVHSS